MSMETKGSGPEAKAAGRRYLPEHVAIIMDGNGRWATKRGLPRTAGHAAGAETFRRIARHCRDIGIRYLTVYACSTENWKRTAEEVSALMGLLKKYLQEAIRDMEKERTKLCVMGDLSRLSPELRTLSEEALAVSRRVEGLQVNVCFNYGGRDELVRAAGKYALDYAAGRAGELTEEVFASYLDSRDIPDPDMVIRTGGEQRISNFLLWQSAYAEYYFTKTLWPDFTPAELERAIAACALRERRYGGVK